MKFPKELKAAREAAKLSQAELATKLDVAPSTVADWESGHMSPRLDKLPAIAKALKTTVAELVA
jgi:transcriptional regulator with XRE-family HTH domain